MAEDPTDRERENRSTADADTTSNVASGESGRGERGAGTTPGTGGSAADASLDDAEGKTVVDHEGETIGVVEEVEGSTLYVDPDPGLTDRISASLGWGDRDDDDRPIDAGLVYEVTDDRVVLEHSDTAADIDDDADTDVGDTGR